MTRSTDKHYAPPVAPHDANERSEWIAAHV